MEGPDSTLLWGALIVGTLTLLLNSAHAHVALTYPPARKYDLDFLDNSRTKAPCGMPRGSIKTSFLTGAKFNVSWHLGYPHKGGFKIQLLDELERPVLDLTPSIQGSDFISDDATAQAFPVQLPQNYTCLNCTLRLLRQATEWGPNYRFWSCADVDIKPKKEFRETCSGHGRYLLARCKCDRFYYGNKCQFKAECIENNDCGVQGKCIEIDASTKQCFCQPGWFGPACNKKSYVKNTEIDFDLYKTKNLSETFRLYWRVLKEQKEIEVVMVVNGTSYAAVGWRPRSLTSSCKNFPLIGLETAPKGDAKPEPEPSSEPEPTAEPKSEPEPTAEPGAEPTPEPSSEPEPDANKIKKSLFARRSTSDVDQAQDFPEGVIETSVSYQVSAKHGRRKRATSPEPDAEPTSEPEPAKDHESKAEPTSEPSPPSPEPTSEPEPTSKPEPEPTSEPEPKSEPEPEPDAKKVHANLESTPNELKGNDHLNPYTPRHDFNPMDCTDIVIGMARNGVSRIGDYYTRDRSTPRVDSYWGGKDDLTAALGYEKDGVTVILFRKKLTAKEQSDHSIEDDLMHVIWAQGQEIGRYVHVPKSGVETSNAKIKDFYKPDELKYHGHGAQRGATTINFLEEKVSALEAGLVDEGELDGPAKSNCSGEWKLPKNCDPENYTCEYSARWLYLPRKDEIRFTITTSHTDLWTGIAFSDDDRMSQTDAILGWVDVTGRPFMMDTWISGYTQPFLDPYQNIYNTTASINNGITTLSFVRKRNTNDPKDLAFTDDHCLYMMFPVKGGPFNMRNKKIRRHESIPIVSTERICIRSCGDDYEDILDAATTPEPPGIGYNVAIKVVDLGENFHFPKPGTIEYDELSNSISENFKPLFNKIPGYRKITVQDLKEESNDVIAKLNLQLDKAVVEKGRSLEDEIAHDDEVHKIIQDSLLSGTVGALKVDENFLTFEPQGTTSNVISDASEERGSFFSLSETKLYLVLGCIAALVLVAIIQASCTIYKTASKSSSSHKDHLIPNSAWKDYSAAANTNYAFDTLEEEKKQVNGKGRSETLPAKNSRARPHQGRPINQSAADTRSLQRPRGGYPPGNLERSTFSLPRTAYDRSRPAQDMQPDFYFMPSQRKYSGEVVRVYVDYNNQPK